jgi:hypothetical protein
MNEYDQTSQIENFKVFGKSIEETEKIKEDKIYSQLREKIESLVIIDKNAIHSVIINYNLQNKDRKIFLDNPSFVNKLIVDDVEENNKLLNKNQNICILIDEKERNNQINKLDSYSYNFKTNCLYIFRILLFLIKSIFYFIFKIIYYAIMVVLAVLEFVLHILIFVICFLYFLISSCCKLKNENPFLKHQMKLKGLPFLENIKKNKFILFIEPKNLFFIKTTTKPNHNNYVKIQVKDLDEPTKIYYIIPRPFVKEFIVEMSKFCKLNIFTSDRKSISQNIEAIYDPQNLIQEHFYSNDMIFFEGDYFYNLDLLPSKKDNILFLDTNNNFIKDLNYYFEVKRFYGYQDDSELKSILSFFKDNIEIDNANFKLKSLLKKKNIN